MTRQTVVTGGSRGIGAACARRLAADGFEVVITYLSEEQGASRIAEEIDGRAYRLDLRDREETVAVARRIEEDGGPVGVLVHNAGAIRDALLPFLADESWDEILEVNLTGCFRLTKALIKGMLRERWGRVISIASLSGVSGHEGQAHYSAAKAGLIAFTKTVALEGASYGVTANAVAPGFVETEMLAGLSEEQRAEYQEDIPLGRFGQPEEVAALVSYLASEEAGYVTGQTIRIDGGLVTS